MTEISESGKRSCIDKCLNDDVLALDIKVSLLQSALSSYRHDSVLRPYPPMFLADGDGSRDFRTLEKAANGIQNLKQVQSNNMSQGPLDLLHWICRTGQFTLHTCKKEKYEVIQKLTGQSAEAPQPTHIFEVVMSETADEKFRLKKSDRKSYFAYHGSRLENFHSILHHGLQSHLNKNSLFGEGTYLSGELSVSMPYAPTGKSWEKSSIGDRLSVIAVVEVIDDPSVKCQIKSPGANTSLSRARASDSLGGDVPEKYYVVQNSEMMRLKYLLVYAEFSKITTSVQPSWIYRHRFILTMIGYMLLLVIVGLYNSRSFKHQVKKWLR